MSKREKAECGYCGGTYRRRNLTFACGYCGDLSSGPNYCGSCGKAAQVPGNTTEHSLDDDDLAGAIGLANVNGIHIAGTASGPAIGGFGGTPIGTKKRPVPKPNIVGSSGRRPVSPPRKHMLDLYEAAERDAR